MRNKIKIALQDPQYALYLLRKRISTPLGKKLFGFDAAYRSDSENGEYAAAVHQALSQQATFEQFKRMPAYRHILEHLTQAQGQAYLDILQSREDGVLTAALDSVLISDKVGNPIKYRYSGIEPALSPTTLRYTKVASDCLQLFGQSIAHVAEIGCGYGGQCLVNDKLLGYEFATLFDLPFVNQLIKRYLDYTLMDGAFEVATINEKKPADYDLVISNYAFSELPSALQETYIKKVLARSKRGYLTMNSGIGGDRDRGKLSLAALRQALPDFECIEESPLTSAHNYLIVWGHNPQKLEEHFTPKAI